MRWRPRHNMAEYGGAIAGRVARISVVRNQETLWYSSATSARDFEP